MELYSQAVEYYNGISDDKFTIYQDRIQNMLVRPEILTCMSSASANPEAHRREEEMKKQRLESMAPDELEKMRQDDIMKRKKERAVKMKLNNEMQENIKLETDKDYQEVNEILEQSQKKANVAKLDIQRDISKQKSNL